MIEPATVAIVALALVASVSDLRTRRIPNRLTFGAAAAGCLFFLVRAGLPGLGWSVAGWLVAVLLFAPFFVLRGLGAGDVKLLGAFGAWLGPQNALYLALFTAIAGGVMALVVVLARGYLKQAFQNLWVLLVFWRFAGIRPLPELTLEKGRGPRLAYALPIAAGALTTIWLH
jgi:prepilin peptidase CpaA